MKRLTHPWWTVTGFATGACLLFAGAAFPQGAPSTPPQPAPTLSEPAPSSSGLAAPGADAEIPPAAPGEADLPLNPDDFEFLSRGPVHEAFAEQYDADPEPGLFVAKQPPEPVDEIPPDVRPQGENVLWIPGYWAWDDDREDFIYVSGTWRIAPEGQRWVPGYWAEATNGDENGWQWVSGFWTPMESTELAYLPQPPESLDNGPVGESPSDSHFWRPGHWQYSNSASYQWSPGYWAQGYDNYAWIPDRYVWTPHGYIFANGYWDGSFATRGFLYSPVYIPPRYVYRPYGFRYRPRFVVSIGNFGMHLFVRPRYRHYYFGDYYGGGYGSRFGIHYWGNWHGRNRRFDPMLSFYSRYHRRHHRIDYIGRLNAWHGYYARNEQFRPPRTIRAQADFANLHRGNNVARSSILTRDFNDAVRDLRSDRIVRLSTNDVRREQQFGRDLRDISRLRNNTEVASRRNLAGTPGSREGNVRDNARDNNRPGSREVPGNIRDQIGGRGEGSRDRGERGGEGSRRDVAGTGDRLRLPEASRVPIRTPRGETARGDSDSNRPGGPAAGGRQGTSRDPRASTGREGSPSLRELSGRSGERPSARPLPAVTSENANRRGPSTRETPRASPDRPGTPGNRGSGADRGSSPGDRPQINRPQGDRSPGSRPQSGATPGAGSGDRTIQIQPRNRPEGGDRSATPSPRQGQPSGEARPGAGSGNRGSATPSTTPRSSTPSRGATPSPGATNRPQPSAGSRPSQGQGPRGIQPSQPRSNQPSAVQPRPGQPSTVQPRSTQPRPQTIQPRPSQPQPRSIQPQPQPRQIQPGTAQPRASQPNTAQPRSGGAVIRGQSGSLQSPPGARSQPAQGIRGGQNIRGSSQPSTRSAPNINSGRQGAAPRPSFSAPRSSQPSFSRPSQGGGRSQPSFRSGGGGGGRSGMSGGGGGGNRGGGGGGRQGRGGR